MGGDAREGVLYPIAGRRAARAGAALSPPLRPHVYVETPTLRAIPRYPVSRRNTSLFGIPATAPTRRPRSRTPGFLRSWAKSCCTGFNTLMYVFATRCYPPTKFGYVFDLRSPQFHGVRSLFGPVGTDSDDLLIPA